MYLFSVHHQRKRAAEVNAFQKALKHMRAKTHANANIPPIDLMVLANTAQSERGLLSPPPTPMEMLYRLDTGYGRTKTRHDVIRDNEEVLTKLGRGRLKVLLTLCCMRLDLSRWMLKGDSLAAIPNQLAIYVEYSKDCRQIIIDLAVKHFGKTGDMHIGRSISGNLIIDAKNSDGTIIKTIIEETDKVFDKITVIAIRNGARMSLREILGYSAGRRYLEELNRAIPPYRYWELFEGQVVESLPPISYSSPATMAIQLIYRANIKRNRC